MREEDRGAAERLLDLVLGSGAHLWHNRAGVSIDGRWYPATTRFRDRGERVSPGLFVPAAVALYRQLVDIYTLDSELMAHFASYALLETEWRDLKVTSAALMLVQPISGQPIRDDAGAVALVDDDYREIGEAMMLWYRQRSTRMMSPKMVLRTAQLLEVPEIAAINREAGFADPAARKPPLGRWPKAARQWLAFREQNPALLDGLVAAGYKNTIKALARKSGYRPESPRFFEVLGWPQTQSSGGHRRVGMQGLTLRKQERFDGLDEAQICERIVAERIGYKDAVGRLPAGMQLTPAIMVALLPSLSDRDLRILTPTLESLGLLGDAEVKARWERAVQAATDQRALNIAKNVRNREIREQLEGAADAAARSAVKDATAGADIHVLFLIDRSGSMEGAIETSKDVLVKILAGFPPEKLHVAAFDTTGKVLRPKVPTRVGVDHMLRGLRAAGGTMHASALVAFRRDGVTIPDGAELIMIIVGDEAGEDGQTFVRWMHEYAFVPDAIALILNVASGWGRGSTVRDAARALQVPFSEIPADHFDDPYQVTRILGAMLHAAVLPGGASGLLDRVLATPLLEKP
jgi:hypothetical protein